MIVTQNSPSRLVLEEPGDGLTYLRLTREEGNIVVASHREPELTPANVEVVVKWLAGESK